MWERNYEMETELKRRFKEYYFLKTLDNIQLRFIRLSVSDPQITNQNKPNYKFKSYFYFHTCTVLILLFVL